MHRLKFTAEITAGRGARLEGENRCRHWAQCLSLWTLPDASARVHGGNRCRYLIVILIMSNSVSQWFLPWTVPHASARVHGENHCGDLNHILSRSNPTAPVFFVSALPAEAPAKYVEKQGGMPAFFWRSDGLHVFCFTLPAEAPQKSNQKL